MDDELLRLPCQRYFPLNLHHIRLEQRIAVYAFCFPVQFLLQNTHCDKSVTNFSCTSLHMRKHPCIKPLNFLDFLHIDAQAYTSRCAKSVQKRGYESVGREFESLQTRKKSLPETGGFFVSIQFKTLPLDSSSCPVLVFSRQFPLNSNNLLTDTARTPLPSSETRS